MRFIQGQGSVPGLDMPRYVLALDRVCDGDGRSHASLGSHRLPRVEAALLDST